MDVSSFGLVWRLEGDTAAWPLKMSPVCSVNETWPVISVLQGAALPVHTHLNLGFSDVFEASCIVEAPGIGRYNITPRVVTIHPMEQADPQAVQLFMWGSVAGALLHLHGLLALHGSTVRLPDGTAAVFCGHSGAGKSTTVAALGKRGLACVADDLSAIRIDAQGQAWVYPGLPRVKLWSDALSLLNMTQGARIIEGIDKYYVDMAVCTEPLRLTRFYELDVRPGGDVAVLPIEGMARVTALLTHTYRPLFVRQLGLMPAHMTLVARLAPLLKMARVTRPAGALTLQGLVDLVLRDFA
jgi:hypothetical protein